MGRLPHVDHTIPSNGATNVSRNLRSIQIRFDRPMKPDARLSLASDPGAFELKGASINYGVDTNTFTIKRRGTKPLPPYTIISFTVNPRSHPEAGFVDLNGHRAKTYSFSFTTGGKEAKSPGPTNVGTLGQILEKRFNKEELRVLCFDLGVNYDDLPGEGIAVKVRELVAYFRRRKCLDVLVNYIRQERPDIRL